MKLDYLFLNMRKIFFRSFSPLLPMSLIFLFATNSQAQNCNSLQNSKDLYECTIQNSPEYKAAELTKESARAARDKITQWPNPELSMKSISGKNAGEKVGGTELNLSISLTDLLIKRSALSKSGRSEEKLLSIEAQEQAFLAKSSVIKDLYRYRQVLSEIELLADALDTFTKIEQQFKGRRSRSPEQEVTLNLVELAQSDYQLRKNHLDSLKAEIEAKFKGIFGSQFEFKKNLLPNTKKNWPEVSLATISNQTLELRKLEAEKEKYEAEKSVANAESWPRISAGPTAERTTEGPNQYNSYGFNVTVGIPLFSLNGGARKFAETNMMKAQLQYEYALRKADLERELLVRRYKSSVEALRKSSSTDSVKNKHDKIDDYFRQGLTSGTSVIEAHRQMIEFTTSQNEHEMVALESLMYLNLLAEKDPSEVISN